MKKIIITNLLILVTSIFLVDFAYYILNIYSNQIKTPIIWFLGIGGSAIVSFFYTYNLQTKKPLLLGIVYSLITCFLVSFLVAIISTGFIVLKYGS